jgi:hypothetical protein
MVIEPPDDSALFSSSSVVFLRSLFTRSSTEFHRTQPTLSHRSGASSSISEEWEEFSIVYIFF